MTLTLPAQTLQDDFNRAGPALGISSSAVPWGSGDLINSTNFLKILSNQLGATHPTESAVLTLDRGPDCSLGAVVAVVPDVGGDIELVIRQHPSMSFGYGGYLVVVACTATDTWTWRIERRDSQMSPVTLGAVVTDGPALEAGCWVGAQVEDDTIAAWFVAAADVTTDGSTVSFDTGDAVNVLERTDANYALPGTYALVLGDTTVRLDCLTGSGAVILPDPPVNTVLPTLIGAAHTDNTLTVNIGTWINPVDLYEYQWLRDGSDIPGETSVTYVLVLADERHQISCRVTASNAGGDGEAETDAVMNTRSTAGQPWAHNGIVWVPMFVRRS